MRKRKNATSMRKRKNKTIHPLPLNLRTASAAADRPSERHRAKELELNHISPLLLKMAADCLVICPSYLITKYAIGKHSRLLFLFLKAREYTTKIDAIF
jgi:hypothetical protein